MVFALNNVSANILGGLQIRNGGNRLDHGLSNEVILDIYIYETTQNIEQLEKIIMTIEKAKGLAPDTV